MAKLALLVCLFVAIGGQCFAQLVITVGPDNEDFDNLQDAITSLGTYTGNETEAKVLISDSTYVISAPVCINFGRFLFTKLTLESVNGADSCTLLGDAIEPPNSQPAKLFYIVGNNSKELYIKNLTLSSDHDEYPIYYQYVSLHIAQFEGCNLLYNKLCMEFINGNAPQGVNIALIANDFTDTNTALSQTHAGIYIHDVLNYTPQTNITISGNTFNDFIYPIHVNSRKHTTQIVNNAFSAPANDGATLITDANVIVVDDICSPANSHLTFTGNRLINTCLYTDGIDSEIENNNFWTTEALDNVGGFIQLFSKSTNSPLTTHISDNIFFGDAAPGYGCINAATESTSINSNSVTLYIDGNSFLNTTTALRVEYDSDIPQHQISSFKNNLLVCSTDPMLLHSYDGTMPTNGVSIDHCLFENGYPSNNSYFVVDSPSCPIEEPDINIDGANHTYTLTWNYNVRSPLINSGTPIIDGIQTDPDGTPPDIGAVYYPHTHKEYVFPSFWPSGAKIKWMSFPVIDDRSYTAPRHWNELGYLFEEHMLNTPDDNQIVSASWSYDSNASDMSYDGDWSNTTELAIQPKGFKLEFNQNVTTIDPVIVNGFKADAATTPVELFNGTNNDFENWIGYFVPYTQGAGSAFGKYLPGSTSEKYLDYIYSIQTQTWSTKRMFPVAGSQWMVDPNRYTLSEGDMVSILLLPHAPEEMFWYITLQSETPRIRDTAVNFSYTEELDYTPIFIEFDPNDLPDEVGLMVAGECKGAAVVDSSLIEVNYYASSAAKGEDDTIEVMFYYGGKGTKQDPDTKVYNPDTMLFEDGKLKANRLGDYGYISFNRAEGATLVPLVTELKQNYPNPFKGITNISWVLEKDEPISVDIYNLKGQKVKSLYNGMGKKGRQVLSWDAKDNNGQSVASGIYFYRLNTPEGSKVQKMMVLR